MWSSGAIFAKFGLYYASPIIFLFFRLLLSAFILWGVVLVLKTALPAKIKDWLYIMVTGLCMQVGYQLFYFLSLDNSISPGMLAIILGVQPILTAIITKDTKHLVQWFGLVFGIIGLTFVVIDSIMISSINFLGVLSSLVCLTCITAGTLMQKRISINLPSNLAIQYSSGVIVPLILIMFFNQSISWNLMFVLSLLWMTLIISVGANILLYYMINKGTLTNVTSIFYCVPPVTALFDYFVYRNTLKAVTIVGMVLILISLILINKKTHALASK